MKLHRKEQEQLRVFVGCNVIRRLTLMVLASTTEAAVYKELARFTDLRFRCTMLFFVPKVGLPLFLTWSLGILIAAIANEVRLIRWRCEYELSINRLIGTLRKAICSKAKVYP